MSISGCATKPHDDGTVKERGNSFEDVIPLTAANLRGHKMLYDEGWFIITSSRKTLEYAKQRSLVSAGEAFRQVQVNMKKRSAEYERAIASSLQQSVKTGKERIAVGTETSERILEGTGTLAEKL